ncbi:hypothetical protein AX774_g2853 [Zancudomyces culisetae]|uniref:Uncharacterized protein n=1 Tax=Zancudomyces culisetae TaxID=1213189 RepID=A0A1R1PRM9_ZANCU|nr:hypothetical protein AX774_g2853 [Zancudomyces culisetae]|eukprot:OMH83635.1 hypothetical protein AX774_g2853 [Zancudomyces culisetae]
MMSPCYLYPTGTHMKLLLKALVQDFAGSKTSYKEKVLGKGAEVRFSVNPTLNLGSTLFAHNFLYILLNS